MDVAKHNPVKRVCHEIFYPYFLGFEPSWDPDIVLHLVSISSSYLITKFKNFDSAVCITPRRTINNFDMGRFSFCTHAQNTNVQTQSIVHMRKIQIYKPNLFFVRMCKIQISKPNLFVCMCKIQTFKPTLFCLVLA